MSSTEKCERSSRLYKESMRPNKLDTLCEQSRCSVALLRGELGLLHPGLLTLRVGACGGVADNENLVSLQRKSIPIPLRCDLLTPGLSVSHLAIWEISHSTV